MKEQWKAVGNYGTVGLEMVLSMLIGLFLGRWLDARLGTEPVLTILWFFFGLAAAGKAVWRTWKDMQAVTAQEEREQGNPAPLFEEAKTQEKRASEDGRWAPSAGSTNASDEASMKEHDER